MDGTFETLTVSDIVEINRRMTQKFGGLFVEHNNNLLNLGALEHVLSEIDAYLFDEELYPDIFLKAGLIAWRINIGHVFYDGNKRTSMEACRLFLELNNYKMIIDSETVDMAVKIARNEIGFDEFIDWLRNKTIAP